MTNATGTSLTLRGGTAVAEPPPGGGPTALYVSFDLLTADELKAMTVTAPGWQAVVQPGPPQCWALTPARDVVVADGATVSFALGGIVATVAPQPGTLAVGYYNIPGVADDAWEGTVFLQNPPSDGQSLALDLEMDSRIVLVSVGDEKMPTQLTWSLSNPQPDTPLVPDDRPWGTSAPRFVVSFVYGDPPGYGALTTAALGAGMRLAAVNLYGNDWTITPDTLGTRTRWVLQPKNHAVLGAGAASTVEFSLDNIVTPLQPGLTQMYVQHTGVPGYADGFQSFVLRKVRPATIRSFDVQPSWLEATDPPPSLTVSWVIDGDAWAELTSTERLDIATATSPQTLHQPVVRPVEFTLKATPKQSQSPPTLARADLGVVTFQENTSAIRLWGAANMGGVAVNGLAFSPSSRRAYASGQHPNTTGMFWVVDLTTNTVAPPIEFAPLVCSNTLCAAPPTAAGDRLYVAALHSLVAIDVSGAGAASVAEVVPVPDGFDQDWIAPLCVSPDGRFVYAGVRSGVVSYDTANGFNRSTLPGTGGGAAAITVSADGNRLFVLSGGRDTVTVYDLVRRTVVTQFPVGVERTARSDDYARLAIHPNGRRLYATGVVAGVATWSLAGQEPVATSIAVGSPLRDVRVSADGKLVLVGCDDGTIVAIDPATNTVRRTFADPFHSAADAFDVVASIAVDADGSVFGAMRTNAGGGRLSLFECQWQPLPLRKAAP